MAKKTGKTKGQKQTPSNKRPGAGKRAMAASKGGRRKTAGARTPKGKARKKTATNPPRAGKVKRAAAKGRPAAARTTKRAAAKGGSASAGTRKRSASAGARGAAAAKGTRKASPRKRPGGTGREETLAQTPDTGRTRRGPTNPLPTRRSTGTASGAGASGSPVLERARRHQREVDETVPSPPSSLDLDSRGPSAARTGHTRLHQLEQEHTQTGPVLTAGDVDADWEDAYSVGEEAPGGDNPTPDQDIVEEIGQAVGVTYNDNEELKGADKVAERDKHRWELDPASSEDYKERD